jgi:stage V sporulation protein SpoVS
MLMAQSRQSVKAAGMVGARRWCKGRGINVIWIPAFAGTQHLTGAAQKGK